MGDSVKSITSLCLYQEIKNKKTEFAWLLAMKTNLEKVIYFRNQIWLILHKENVCCVQQAGRCVLYESDRSVHSPLHLLLFLWRFRDINHLFFPNLFVLKRSPRQYRISSTVFLFIPRFKPLGPFLLLCAKNTCYSVYNLVKIYVWDALLPKRQTSN